MTEAEVVAFLRKVRFSPALERNAHRMLGLATIAAAAGANPSTLYKICVGTRPSRDIINRVGSAIERLRLEWGDQNPRGAQTAQIEQKRLGFQRKCPFCGRSG